MKSKEEIVKIIKERILQSNLLIESAKKGQDLEDGYTPQERYDQELSIKVAFESLLEEIINK